MKIEVFQILSTCPPIDAEFHADFKNVQLYRVILNILRDISNLLLNFADFAPASLISLNKAVNHKYLIK